MIIVSEKQPQPPLRRQKNARRVPELGVAWTILRTLKREARCKTLWGADQGCSRHVRSWVPLTEQGRDQTTPLLSSLFQTATMSLSLAIDCRTREARLRFFFFGGGWGRGWGWGVDAMPTFALAKTDLPRFKRAFFTATKLFSQLQEQEAVFRWKITSLQWRN